MPEPARLLLVEDDRQLASMLEQILVGEGYDVDVARDGQRGLHLGLTRTYDVIVLDRGLPAIEGLDLLGRLRSRGVLTPALVLSALGNPGRPRRRAGRRRRGLHEQAVRRRRARGAAARAASSDAYEHVGDPARPRRHARRGHPAGRPPRPGRWWTSRSGSARSWSCSRGIPARCSAGPRSWTGCSRTPRTRASSTPTCTTCDASWVGRGRDRARCGLPVGCRMTTPSTTGAERDALRRTARRLGVQTAVLVLGCLVVVGAAVLLVVVRAQDESARSRLEGAVSSIDDAHDAPPGMWVAVACTAAASPRPTVCRRASRTWT